MQKKKFISKVSATALAGLMGASALMPGINAAAATTINWDNSYRVEMKDTKAPDGTYILKANSYGVSGEQLKLPGAVGQDNLVAFSLSGESNWGLCLRPSVTSGVTGSGSDSISKKETKFWKSLSDDQKTAIALAMYYGYPVAHGGKDDITAGAYFNATQLIAWEIVLGYRNYTRGGAYQIRDSKYALINFYQVGPKASTSIGKETYKAYRDIEKKMKTHYATTGSDGKDYGIYKNSTLAKAYKKGKTTLFYYSFAGKNVDGSTRKSGDKGYLTGNFYATVNIPKAQNTNEKHWSGAVKDKIAAICTNWNENKYRGLTINAKSKYYANNKDAPSRDGGTVYITADHVPFSPTSTYTHSGAIKARYINLNKVSEDGWVIYAMSDKNQDIAVKSVEPDPATGYIGFAAPNFGNLYIQKAFDFDDESLDFATAKSYASGISFTIRTRVAGTDVYVMGEPYSDSNGNKGYIFTGTTPEKSKATKFKLNLDKYLNPSENSAVDHKYFQTLIWDLPAESAGRTYTVREYVDPNGAAAKDGYAVKGDTIVDDQDVQVSGFDADDPTTNFGTVLAGFENSKDADYTTVKLNKRGYETLNNYKSINLGGKFIACVAVNDQLYYLKNLTRTSDGKYKIPDGSVSQGKFLSDAAALTTDIAQAQELTASKTNGLNISQCPKGVKFGFIEIQPEDSAYGFGNDIKSNEVSLADFANTVKSYTKETDGVIKAEKTVGRGSSGEPFFKEGNYYPFTFGVTSAIGSTKSETLNNYHYYVNILVHKKDASTGRPLPGATITLYKNGTEVESTITDANGNANFATKFGLMQSGGYTYKETKAPDGYKIDDTEYPIKFNKIIQQALSGTYGSKYFNLGTIYNESTSANNISIPDIYNKPFRGEIKLIKTQTQTDERMAGITFAFTASKDLTKDEITAMKVAAGDNAQFASDAVTAGDVFLTINTDKNGEIDVYNLPVGTLVNGSFDQEYTAEEINMPKGLIGYGPYTFTFEPEDYDAELETLRGPAILFEEEDAENSYLPVPIKVTKKDNHDNVVSGVEFKVTALEDVIINGKTLQNKGEVVGTLVTNSNGTATNYTIVGERGGYSYSFNVYGGFKYAITESKVPTGLVLDSTAHEFTAPFDPQGHIDEFTYTQTNRWYIGSVKLLKANSDNDEAIPGATFGLWKDNGDKVFNEEEDVYIRNLVDKGDGNYVSADTNDLEYGTYWVKETQAPEGYVIDDNAYIAEIDQDGKVVTIYNSMDENNQKFYETPIKGDVELIKKDAETGDLLTGAEFTIYNDVNGDGIYNEGDTEYGMLSEEETGVYRLHDVVYGKYVVKETKAPDTFKPDTGDYPVNVTVNKETITVRNTETGDFADQPMKGGITLLKYDKDYPDNKLSGATFVVYKDTNLNNEIDDADEFMGNLVEDTENVGVYSITDLRMGQYLVKETVAPENFNLDEKTYTVILSNDGDFISVENEAGKGFANSPSVGTVTLTKYDARYPDHKLSGAVFNIWKDVNSNGEVDEEDIDLGALTEDDGVYSMSELRIGDYLVREIKAPVGFVLDEGTYEAHITMNGEVYQVINREDDGDFCAGFYNNIKKGDIEITKYDISESETLPNTGIRICKEDGTVVEEKYTDENGEVKFKELEYGKYYFEEFDAPEGYRLNTEKHYFEILENGQVVHGKIVDEIIVGGIKITKYDISKSETLPNTGIRICKEDGTVVEEKYTDENGEVVFENLEYGKYYFEEFDAPDGYELNTEKHYFEITEDGVIIHGEITDEKIPTPPPTGVENNMAIPMMAGAVSAMGLAAVTIVAVAKKKRED